MYLDFSKAFDLVSHSVLLVKLECLGFCSKLVKWIEGFLTGRVMWVSVNGCDSERVEVTSGVPQGSVLGPLLFLIYVNSLADNFECNWYAFADDFKLYASLPKSGRTEPVSALQRDLDCVCRVSSSWNLKLNPVKCVVMKFGGCLPDGDGGGSGYFLGGSELRVVGRHKDLGVLVDRSLKFHVHM